LSGYVPNPPKGYRNAGVEPVDLNAQHWAQYKELPPAPDAKPDLKGCVFAKSCNLPDVKLTTATRQASFPSKSWPTMGYGPFWPLAQRLPPKARPFSLSAAPQLAVPLPNGWVAHSR
jgi:hypothetical protein